MPIVGSLLVSLALLGAAAAAALVGQGPPSPRLGAHPPAQTFETAAAFGFTDAGRVRFECSVNSSRFRSCRSPVRYVGLRYGVHRFSVRARARGGAISPPTVYRWAVRRVRPQIQIGFPHPGGAYRAATWPAGCPRGSGVCGTVIVPGRLAAIRLSVRIRRTDRYWDGLRFSSRRPRFRVAAVSSVTHGSHHTVARWFYPVALPRPDGGFTIRVRAMTGKGAGRLQLQRDTGFVIDTVAPRPPAITTAPANPSVQTSAGLGFTDAEIGLQFECHLDGSAWGACASPISYRNLSPQVHVFDVRAVDRAGNISSATADTWRVALATAAGSTPFTISGNVLGSLYPGGPKRTIPLTFHNPGPSPLAVTAASIRLEPSSLPSGCRPSDYQITQPVMPSSGLPVAAGASVTLPTAQVAAPVISMVNTPGNQDPCRGAKLVFSYTGAASS
jgi:hypothetical protein